MSGRISCTDCGRPSPQGRHAECHVLSLLRGAWTEEYGIGRAVVHTSKIVAEVFGGHDLYESRTRSVIRRLRKKGHRITNFYGGWWRLHEKQEATA